MAVPTLADTFRVTVSYHHGQSTDQNVLHFSSPFANTDQDVADAVGACWMASGSIKVLQSTMVVGDSITVQRYDGLSAPTVCTVSGFTGASMTGVGNPLAPNAAVIATLRTGVAGRANRGRMYLGGCRNAFLDSDGDSFTTNLATIQTGLEAWLSAVAGSSDLDGQVVYSRLNNTANPVTSILARAYVGTQRRRTDQRKFI